MASAAANSALATEVLAVQRLATTLRRTPAARSSCSSLANSGYAFGGLFRSKRIVSCVDIRGPSMIRRAALPIQDALSWVLPLVAMFDSLYKDAAGSSKKLRLFWIAFINILLGNSAEWMFPLLTGFSIFCLANPRSADLTRFFGGSNGNEGLGLLSICFDWQYISGGKQFLSYMRSYLIPYRLDPALMIGGFIHPGKPVANMFFVLFSYNSVTQAQLLLKDLKIAQLLMNSIIDNQRPILLSVEGTNIWSGQQPRQYNSQAVAWGGLRSPVVTSCLQSINAYVVGLFVPVPFWVVYRFWPKLRTDYLYTPVVCYYIGWLCVGINSSIFTYFSIAYVSQWWLRTRYPRWFTKYNYILAAGASGDSHLFPQWWGVNQNVLTFELFELRPAVAGG
ncbi:OPT oligopeptide transporter protein-domain-containing protein [Mycena leptocephala]|nr:OPT oligopeptide transporter protein-domain-containing protein [Mycena leptocephala]